MSSYLIAAPEALATASADLSGIGEAIREATAAAAPSTTGIAAPALDEVSAAITQAVRHLWAGVSGAERADGGVPFAVCAVVVLGWERVCGRRGGNSPAVAAIVQAAQPFGIFSPVEVTGRSLFVNGANGAAGTGRGRRRRRLDHRQRRQWWVGRDGGSWWWNGGAGGSAGLWGAGGNGGAGGDGGRCGRGRR